MAAFASLIVQFMFGMASAGRLELVLFVAGWAVLAGFATFFATFVFGPLAYPRSTLEGSLCRGILAVLSIGFIIVGSAVVQRLGA